MDSNYGHLTYCSNIHPGESWEEHFSELQKHIPLIKQKCSPEKSFGIGLRLSDKGSLDLQESANLSVFLDWLKDNDCYVFTMNGFPFGNFHHAVVKDKVHEPNWTTQDRVDYTIRLANILSVLLPPGMNGGISTSPLSYRHWHEADQFDDIYKETTSRLLDVVVELISIKANTGKSIHIDIEPEPDGLIETGIEFIQWYEDYLLPIGVALLTDRFAWTTEKAKGVIKEHIQLCYDICHFAVGFENHFEVIKDLKQLNIGIGKIQISAALKAALSSNPAERGEVINAFKQFNESTYLHQVIALQKDGSFKKYRDLPDALKDAANPSVVEWRSHFHVPLFVENYVVLQSTQQDITTVLQLHQQEPLTDHLEIETYTWEVLPDSLKLPITQSIIRELEWVQQSLMSDV
jgi:hypothetical protein